MNLKRHYVQYAARAALCAGFAFCLSIGYTASAQSAPSRVTATDDGEYRYVRANGLPNHETGAFPNRNNPNRIAPQNYAFRLPLNPKRAPQVTALRMHPFGVALNGVPFDPGAAEFWNRDFRSGWQYEPKGGSINLGLDQNNAHVQPTGAYHYHAMPVGLIEGLGGDGSDMLLLGYAADGFPIYTAYGYNDPQDPKSGLRKMRSGYRLKSGTRSDGPGGRFDGTFVQDYEYVPGAGDLDECNGRFGPTPEFPDGIYHYHLTDAFPYIPRYFRGTPDVSFLRHGPPAGGGRGRPPRRPPPPGHRPPPR